MGMLRPTVAPQGRDAARRAVQTPLSALEHLLIARTGGAAGPGLPVTGLQAARCLRGQRIPAHTQQAMSSNFNLAVDRQSSHMFGGGGGGASGGSTWQALEAC